MFYNIKCNDKQMKRFFKKLTIVIVGNRCCGYKWNKTLQGVTVTMLSVRPCHTKLLLIIFL